MLIDGRSHLAASCTPPQEESGPPPHQRAPSLFDQLLSKGMIDRHGGLIRGDHETDVSFLAPKLQAHLELPRRFIFKGKEITYTNLELLGGINRFSIVGSSILPEFLKEHFPLLLPWLDQHMTEESKEDLFRKREDVDHRIQLLTDLDDLYAQTNRIIRCLQRKVGKIGNIKEERGLSKLGRGENLVMAGVDDLNSGMRQEFIFHLFDLKNPYLSSADNLCLEVFLQEGKVNSVLLRAAKRPWQEAVVHQSLYIFHLHSPCQLNDRAWIKVLAKIARGCKCLPHREGKDSGEEVLLRKVVRSSKDFGESLRRFFTENKLSGKTSVLLAAAHLEKLLEYKIEVEPFRSSMIDYFISREDQRISRFFSRLLRLKTAEEGLEILGRVDLQAFKEDYPSLSDSLFELELLFLTGKKKRMIALFPQFFNTAVKERQQKSLLSLYEEAGLVPSSLRSGNEEEISLIFAEGLLSTERCMEAIALWEGLEKKQKSKRWLPFVKTLAIKEPKKAYHYYEEYHSTEKIDNRISITLQLLPFFKNKREEMLARLLPWLKKRKITKSNQELLHRFVHEENIASLKFLKLLEIMQRRNVVSGAAVKEKSASLFLELAGEPRQPEKELLRVGGALGLYDEDQKIFRVFLREIAVLNREIQKKVVRLASSKDLGVDEKKSLFHYYETLQSKEITQNLLKEVFHSPALDKIDKVKLLVNALKEEPVSIPAVRLLASMTEALSKPLLDQVKETKYLDRLVVQGAKLNEHEQSLPLYQLIAETSPDWVTAPLERLLIVYLEKHEKKKASRLIALLDSFPEREKGICRKGVKQLLDENFIYDAYLLALLKVPMERYRCDLLEDASVGFSEILALIKRYPFLFQGNGFPVRKILDLLNSKECLPTPEQLTLVFHHGLESGMLTVSQWKTFCRYAERMSRQWDSELLFFRHLSLNLLLRVREKDPTLLQPKLFADFLYLAIYCMRRFDPIELFSFYRMNDFPDVPMDPKNRLELVQYLRISLLDAVDRIEPGDRRASMLNRIIILDRTFVFHGNLGEEESLVTLNDQELINKQIRQTLTFETSCYAKALSVFRKTAFEEKIERIMKLLEGQLEMYSPEYLCEGVLEPLLENLFSSRSVNGWERVVGLLLQLIDEKMRCGKWKPLIKVRISLIKLMVFINPHILLRDSGRMVYLSRVMSRLVRNFYADCIDRYQAHVPEGDFSPDEQEKEMFKFGSMQLSNRIKLDPSGFALFDELFHQTPMRKFLPEFFVIPFTQLDQIKIKDKHTKKPLSMAEDWYLNLKNTDRFYDLPLSIHKKIIQKGRPEHFDIFKEVLVSPAYCLEDRWSLVELLVKKYPGEMDELFRIVRKLAEENPEFIGRIGIFLHHYSPEDSPFLKSCILKELPQWPQEQTIIFFKAWFCDHSSLEKWAPYFLKQNDLQDLMVDVAQLVSNVSERKTLNISSFTDRLLRFFQIAEEDEPDPKKYFKGFLQCMNCLLHYLALLIHEGKLYDQTFSLFCLIFYRILDRYYIDDKDPVSLHILEVCKTIFFHTMTPINMHFPTFNPDTIRFMMNVTFLDKTNRRSILIGFFVDYIYNIYNDRKKLLEVKHFFEEDFLPNLKENLICSPQEIEMDEFEAIIRKQYLKKIHYYLSEAENADTPS